MRFSAKKDYGFERRAEAAQLIYRKAMGEFVRTNSVVDDLTEDCRAALVTQHLAAVIETTADAIYLYDLEGRILSWNKGAEKLYGWTAAEIVGQPIAAIVPPERMHECITQILSAVTRDEPVVNLETVRQRRDGSRFDAMLTASPVRDAEGQTTALSVITRNISARKEQERKLRESEERYRTLFNLNQTTGDWHR